MSVSPGQGCTWLKTLGPLCVPEPEVNLSEVNDGRKVLSAPEHVSQTVSEQVRIPWSEACLRKLRGSLQAAPPPPPGHPTTSWPPPWGARLLGGHRVSQFLVSPFQF